MTTEFRTTTYGPSGRQLDVHRPGAGAGRPSGPLPTVLLWHGRGPDERDVLAPFARATAALGVLVLVPDWRPDSADGGLADLTDSVAFARQHADGYGGSTERITLAGWSLGGKCAVAAALHPVAPDGWRPHAVAALAGGFTTPAPFSGTAPVEEARRADLTVPQVPVLLVHGTEDTIVEARQSHDLAAALTGHGWPVTVEELRTDHAGVVMTTYSPTHARCLPAPTGPARHAGQLAARLLAAHAQH
ncbi:alpha/beta hydrolase [Kitasatospora sp. McL0602]|uniref:alpha/beta hydrolase n=1 Tax=Kitasatospora sp. McL0602 TaxID=3439530 RepID=UPI003F89C44F